MTPFIGTQTVSRFFRHRRAVCEWRAVAGSAPFKNPGFDTLTTRMTQGVGFNFFKPNSRGLQPTSTKGGDMRRLLGPSPNLTSTKGGDMRQCSESANVRKSIGCFCACALLFGPRKFQSMNHVCAFGL